MGLSTGLIGLPNVGKSTLFNAITNMSVEAANYPFATIEPNIGIVNLIDDRLIKLSQLYNCSNTIFTSFKFVDIAGLVKGASKGEGLGNKFLSNIKDVDSICHIIRCFDDNSITHVNNKIDPIDDLKTINTELILSDYEIVNNRYNKILKNPSKEFDLERSICKKLLSCFENEKLSNTLVFDVEEKNIVKSYNLLTFKPILYIANVDEKSMLDIKNNKYYFDLEKEVGKENIIYLSAKIEYEISKLDSDEKIEYLKLFNMKQPVLNVLTFKSYELLGLKTFFTAGQKECRAWTFKSGMTAKECAGVIHTDFEKGFIKAEVISYEDMIMFKNELEVKEHGKLKIVGKDYIVNDADICNFKFRV